MKIVNRLPITVVVIILISLGIFSLKNFQPIKSQNDSSDGLKEKINLAKESKVGIQISPAKKDLGRVIYGDIAKTEFTLANFSRDSLAITRVSTSCSCTSAEVVKEKLNPDEDTKVKVSFNPAIHGDDTDVGEVTRTIYIDTDNPNFKQITAVITARVVKK